MSTDRPPPPAPEPTGDTRHVTHGSYQDWRFPGLPGLHVQSWTWDFGPPTVQASLSDIDAVSVFHYGSNDTFAVTGNNDGSEVTVWLTRELAETLHATLGDKLGKRPPPLDEPPPPAAPPPAPPPRDHLLHVDPEGDVACMECGIRPGCCTWSDHCAGRPSGDPPPPPRDEPDSVVPTAVPNAEADARGLACAYCWGPAWPPEVRQDPHDECEEMVAAYEERGEGEF